MAKNTLRASDLDTSKMNQTVAQQLLKAMQDVAAETKEVKTAMQDQVKIVNKSNQALVALGGASSDAKAHISAFGKKFKGMLDRGEESFGEALNRIKDDATLSSKAKKKLLDEELTFQKQYIKSRDKVFKIELDQFKQKQKYHEWEKAWNKKELKRRKVERLIEEKEWKRKKNRWLEETRRHNRDEEYYQQYQKRENQKKRDELEGKQHLFGKWGKALLQGHGPDKKKGFGGIVSQATQDYGSYGKLKLASVLGMHTMALVFKTPLFTMMATGWDRHLKEREVAARELDQYNEQLMREEFDRNERNQIREDEIQKRELEKGEYELKAARKRIDEENESLAFKKKILEHEWENVLEEKKLTQYKKIKRNQTSRTAEKEVEKVVLELPAHAAGGTMAGGPAIVGEKGPELVEGKKGAFVMTTTNLVRNLTKLNNGFGGIMSTVGRKQEPGKIFGSLAGRLLAKPMSLLNTLPAIKKTEDQQLIVLKAIQKGIADLKPKAAGPAAWVDTDKKAGGGAISLIKDLITNPEKVAAGMWAGSKILGTIGATKLGGKVLGKIGLGGFGAGAGAAGGAAAGAATGVAGKLGLKAGARLIPGVGIIASGLLSGGAALSKGEGWGAALGKGALSAVGTGIGQLLTGGIGGGVAGGLVGDYLGDMIFGKSAEASVEPTKGNELLDQKKKGNLQEEAYKAMIDLRDMGLPALMSMGQNADIQQKEALTVATGMKGSGPTPTELHAPPEENIVSPIVEDEKLSVWKRIGSWFGGGQAASTQLTPTVGGTAGGSRFVEIGGERRIGGTKNLRNNNPGNIRMSDHARKYGATTKDADGFAIFPTMKAGEDAQRDLLFKSNLGTSSPYGKGKAYKDKTIEEAIYTYAPPTENRSRQYADAMIRKMGGNRKLSDLSPQEQEYLRQSIADYEGKVMPRIEKATAAAPPGNNTGMNLTTKAVTKKKMMDASRVKEQAKAAYNNADTTIMAAVAAQKKAAEKKQPINVAVPPPQVVVQGGSSKDTGPIVISSGDNETSVSSLYRYMRG